MSNIPNDDDDSKDIHLKMTESPKFYGNLNKNKGGEEAKVKCEYGATNIEQKQLSKHDNTFWCYDDDYFLIRSDEIGCNDGIDEEAVEEEQKELDYELDKEQQRKDTFLKQQNIEWFDSHDNVSIKSDEIQSDDGVDKQEFSVCDEKEADRIPFCVFCCKRPFVWYNYAPEVISYFKKYRGDVLKYVGKRRAKEVQRKRKFQTYRLMEKIRTNHTIRGYGICVRFLSCVVDEVRRLFPDPDDEYVGFKEAKKIHKLVLTT